MLIVRQYLWQQIIFFTILSCTRNGCPFWVPLLIKYWAFRALLWTSPPALFVLVYKKFLLLLNSNFLYTLLFKRILFCIIAQGKRMRQMYINLLFKNIHFKEHFFDYNIQCKYFTHQNNLRIKNFWINAQVEHVCIIQVITSRIGDCDVTSYP